MGKNCGGAPKPPKKPKGKGKGKRMVAALAVAVSMLAGSATSTGCAWWSKSGPVITDDGKRVAACVLVNYDDLEAAEKSGGLMALAAAIAKDCGNVAVDLVLDLFHSFKAQKAAKAAKLAASASGASGAK